MKAATLNDANSVMNKPLRAKAPANIPGQAYCA